MRSCFPLDRSRGKTERGHVCIHISVCDVYLFRLSIEVVPGKARTPDTTVSRTERLYTFAFPVRVSAEHRGAGEQRI